MSNNTSTPRGGVSLTTVLLVVFIILKLCHLIKWSWWWVLSPLWIGAAICLLVLGIVGIVWFIYRR